ncbi:auxin-responsive protein SAUR76 [Primulina eburnea]|uniref:auxin-responsive protein SAUR76 n=1 Tax=Primulina eburnea TaxID=1245227 RepID=UPI003C6C3071
MVIKEEMKIDTRNVDVLKVINSKCKTFSRQLGRTLSYNSLRSKSNRDHGFQESWDTGHDHQCSIDFDEPCETIFVGSSRKRYTVSSKHLNHPLLNALIEKSNENSGSGRVSDLSVKCEVVLFDHILWMLDNADPTLTLDSLEELAELYAY